MDQAGNLYGTTNQGGTGTCNYGDPGCGTVFKLDTTGPAVWPENFLPPQVDGNADLPAGEMITSGSGTPKQAVDLWLRVIKQWKTLPVMWPADACIYTVRMDPPQMQARWQESTGMLHQALSAHRSEPFGQQDDVWFKESRQLARAVFVLDRTAYIVYTSRRHDEREPSGFGGSVYRGKKMDNCDFDPPLKK